MSDSSSSSDSEDDSRFKAACDPTLSVCFTRPETTKEEKTPTLDKPSTLTDSKHCDVIDDPRESFTLVNRVKQSVANLHSNKGYQRTADFHQTRSKSSVVSSRKRKTDTDSPSPYSTFLAKHLSSVLEKNVKFEATPSQNHTAQETGGGPSSIFILKNVTLKAYTEEDAEKDRKKRKKAATKAMKKYSYFDSSDEEEVSSRCRSLAVTPDWLINNNHFPWPHPKNTRYLDEYILKERRADGSIVATSKETSSEGICAGVMKIGERHEGHQQKCKSKKLVSKPSTKTGNVKVGFKLMNGNVNGILKSKDSGDQLADNNNKFEDNDIKQRKQKRRRGKRKKT